jgi:hypothetical protein
MLRLRQICLVAKDLDTTETDLSAVFGLAVCHRDTSVGRFGLHNFLMPVGNSFLEVVAPTEDKTAAGRYLERRGGEGGYMVIMQTDDVVAARQRMTALGVRVITDGGNGHTDGIQLHPADVPGAIAELRWNEGDADIAGPWHPAGANWLPTQRFDVIRVIRAAELQASDPAALATRWSEVLDRFVETDAAGCLTIALDDATLRFVPITDGRPEGLAALDVEVVDRPRLLAAAQERSCTIEGDTVTVCGTRFNLV